MIFAIGDMKIEKDEKNVAFICASCFFHIRAFRHIRPNLTQGMVKSVAVSLISSRLDYCNCLVYGSSQAIFWVHNVIAKLVCAGNASSLGCINKSFFSHIKFQ